jgi:hypothetical protein
VVVAVIAMGVVESSIHQIIGVISVRYPFMTTTWTMLVRTSRLRGAIHGVGRVDREDVLVDMISMNVVQVAVMQIIDMTVMANRCMPAVRAMLMGVVGMLFLGAGGHRGRSLSSVASNRHYFSEACSKAF